MTNNSNNQLLKNEKRILTEAQELLSNHHDQDPIPYHDFEFLTNKYQKLLKQLELIMKISDKNHHALKETETQLNEKITELLNTKQKLEESNRKLARISSLDKLTGLPNRREFEKVIVKEWRRAIRSAYPFTIIMIDIDNFKKYNDNYGHLAGDHCLEKVAAALQKSLERAADFIARYGGEEFVAVLPDTDHKGGKDIAEKMREAVWQAKLPHEYSDVANYVTISLGAATTKDTDQYNFEELLDLADQALYQSKAGGRNRYTSIIL